MNVKCWTGETITLGTAETRTKSPGPYFDDRAPRTPSADMSLPSGISCLNGNEFVRWRLMKTSIEELMAENSPHRQF